MSWCDLDLIFDLGVVTLTFKILPGLYLVKWYGHLMLFSSISNCVLFFLLRTYECMYV